MAASTVHKLFSLVVLLSLALQPFAVTGKQVDKETSRQGVAAPAPAGLYRTTVTVDSPARRARLEALGVVVLSGGAEEQGSGGAEAISSAPLPLRTSAQLVVLADADQLEALARLRFEPRATDDADALVAAHAADKPWLAAAWGEMQRISTDKRMTMAAALVSLSTLSLSTALASLTSIDDDGDGLTNTQEAWWCTDPMNPDTDSDGRTDGAEIQALKDWMANKRAAAPNETPWPSWPFNATTCPDKDHDSIPNLAERWELGLNMDLESSDRDRYDDGQELFGTTYCPGSGNACGYGQLPSANHDGILLFPHMPSWVMGAGKHPLVAAYPKLDFAIVKDGDGFEFKIRTATVVTTDQRHEEGETKSYSTTKTEGTSTSDAETETWENWQEYSKTTEAAARMAIAQSMTPQDTYINSTEQRLQVTDVRMKSVTNNTMKVKINNTYQSGGSSFGGEISAPVTSFVVDEACAEMGCRKYIGSGIKASVRTFADVVEGTLLGTSDKIQNEFQANKCDPTSFNPSEIWCRIKSAGTLWKKNYDERLAAATTAEQQSNGMLGGNYLQTGPSSLDISRIYPITFPEPRFIPTETNTTGSSTGGARTTTHTTYEEHAVTEGTAKQFGQSWGTATAQNSTHAADLWFAYALSNIGNDYARVICDLAINIYIGDREAPVATYYPGNDLGGDGCFSNFQPGETHKYSFPSQSRIALTLDQMAAIDQGEAVQFVIEDCSLGQDDFYADDAIGAGVQISIEDGTADGDETIDTYLIPTWGTETVLDVLGRYFPHTTDADGLMIAIWTPEYRADTPAWCVAPQVVGTGSQRTLWCKHALSTADWWNVYTNGMGDGTEGFQDTPASPGSVALFRFNQDSDLDGYSDRSELRLGTDPNDPASHPRPELIAGVHSIKDGNYVIATLSLLNTGLYDAYGVEAVMIAPNDTISITNNTVGGSGRVRAQKQVIVGSRIALQTPLPAAWLTAGHAQPTAGGYYTGTTDLTYTFTAADSGSVGAGTLRLNWSDGAGGSGTLNFGAGYQSPTLLDVSNGVKLGLLSGTLNAGESFTMAATTPRDTFQYTIAAGHESDFTPPVVIVSYNDPQGNHRFAIPTAAMALSSPSADLMTFSGQMLEEPGVEIVTTEGVGVAGFGARSHEDSRSSRSTKDAKEAAADGATVAMVASADGATTATAALADSVAAAATRFVSSRFVPSSPSGLRDPNASSTFHLVVNNPTEATLTAAHLFVEFVNISGTVVSEIPVSVTLPPGPTVQPVTFDTATFDPPYNPDEDYIVMAFLTDYQGNILDTAARPLSSFQEDPKPAFAMAAADETWDFGTAQQGTLMQRQFTLGSVGYMDLLTHLGAITGATVSGHASRSLPPGDTATYTVTINTQSLPVGAFERTIPVRTSDPDNPTKTITIRGNITAMPPDAPGGATLRPLDVPVPVSGTQGEWKDFTHTLGPEPQTLHPVKVYSQDYATLWGVGKYATAFGSGTASYDIFGDGQDDLTVGAGQTEYTDNVRRPLASTAPEGQRTLYVGAVAGFQMGGEVLVTQMQGTGAGNYEFGTITGIDGGLATLTLQVNLQHTYTVSSNSKAQVVQVPHYRNVTVQSGGTLTAHAWDGNVGGIVAFRAADVLNIPAGGVINADATGYRGAPTNNGGYTGMQGEGINGPGVQSTSANANGGGGGQSQGYGNAAGGGGGGNGSAGTKGEDGQFTGGNGGAAVDLPADLSVVTPGGGGGSGGDKADNPNPDAVGGAGGTGGGTVLIFARQTSLAGAISSNGGNGQGTGDVWKDHGGGGGGAGGSILVVARDIAFLGGLVRALGGQGGVALFWNSGGPGGVGRIRVEYQNLSGSINLNPSAPYATTAQRQFYIVEQINSAPYDRARLNLPESGDHTYQVQYGRRLVFGGSGTQTPSIRMPKQLYATASLDALVSNTGVSSGPLNLSLDIGNDGTNNWTYSNATVSFPATLNATGLAAALNAFIVSQTGVAWGADVDVPVKVTIDRQADVILTNLVLTLQSNQPGALAAAAVEMGADRPLDVPVVIAGAHSQGETYDFTHALGPNADSIHPCKVYDQGGNVLKGVGRYCSDFGGSVVPQDVFGNGRDGSPPSAGVVNTYATATASIGSNFVNTALSVGTGDMVLLHQSSGSGVGQWEVVIVQTPSSGGFYTAKPLKASYTAGAQAVLAPQYQGGTISGSISPEAWNGTTGGIVALASNGSLVLSGSINASETGYAGGREDNAPAYRGEGTGGPSTRGNDANGNGGGGGGNWGQNANDGAGGGGGGNGSPGQPGASVNSGGYYAGGAGGATSGNPELTNMTFGGGGGGPTQCCDPRYGGNGGGIVVLLANQLDVQGTIQSQGGRGQSNLGRPWEPGARTGGGGAGGSIFIRAHSANLGATRVTAAGGDTEPLTDPRHYDGGYGGSGRIRVEYQNITSGWSTNPPASAQQVSFYIAEQVEQPPYTTTRLYLPEQITGGATYLVQYGRRYTFAAAGQAASYLRVKRQVYSTASLEVLVSNTGVASGNLDLCLDIGADTTCDFRHNAVTTFPATLSATGLANALNSYLLAQTAIPWGQPADVPVRVQVDRAADVMLTNLALTPVGAKTRFLRLPARAYDSVSFGIQFGASGTPAGPLAFTVDVGADGTVDFSYSGTPASYPAVIATGSVTVTNAFNAYLTGRTGEVDVPIRIVPSPSLDTALHSFSASPTARPDASISDGDVGFGGVVAAAVHESPTNARMIGGYSFIRAAFVDGPFADPTEGDTVTVNATIHNGGSLDTGPLTAAFYAVRNPQYAWYIGSAFVPNIPASNSAQASIPWNTLGFTGTVPVRVVVDPYNRVVEISETNNVATATVTIRTRPDLSLDPIALSDDEPTAGETVTVTLPVRNTGHTTTGGQTVALYDGNPDAGGTLVGDHVGSPLPGGATTTVAFAWTPTAPGAYRLFARADRDRQVNESDEGNNDTWLDVYVGFRGPITVDSGAITEDRPYSATLGYGYLNTGTRTVACGGSAAPDATLRAAITSTLLYRFDHLLPGHFYHLDLTLRDCDGSRAEEVRVDDMLVVPATDLSDHAAHRLSLLLDPALYRDRSVTVALVETHGLDALLAEISLHDVDYRYADAGHSDAPDDPADPRYPGPADAQAHGHAYGWLDGERLASWGSLPGQTVRMDRADDDPADDPDSELRYRFDGLDPARRYRLRLTFRQLSGAAVIQKLQLDGTDATRSFTLASGQAYSLTVAVPPAAYATDRSIIAGIVRVDCAASEAQVNEIALEEETLPAGNPCHVQATPNRTIATGGVTIRGAAAPVGTVIEAVNPRDDVVGCTQVSAPGAYPYVQIYGEDPPTIPGMRDGEIIEFRVDGIPAVAQPSLYWKSDTLTHTVNLSIGSTEGQCSWLASGWNLISTRLDPPVPTVEKTLGPIAGRYCQVRGEKASYDCTLDPVYRNLKELDPGQGYYLKLEGGAGANLRVEGMTVPVTMPIPLHTYWNWVGYLPAVAQPITTALQSIAGRYLLVLSKDKTYDPLHPGLSDLLTLEPGQGYQIRATQAVTLVYPAGNVTGASESAGHVEASSCPALSPTPYLTLLYGQARLDGAAAPAGAVVEIVTPRGEVAGCTVVREGGGYGYVQVYGEDATDPPIPGFRPGEPLAFRVAGRPVAAVPALAWQNDRTPHAVNLGVGGRPVYLPMVVVEE